MAEDKKDIKKIKNPSVREISSSSPDPVDRLRETLRAKENELREEQRRHAAIKEQWRKHYSKLCIFFLISGIIIGFIIGVILL